MKSNSLQEKIEKLFERQRFGIKMGLEIETEILSLLLHPEHSYPVIHIAGTNGKGSTAAIIHSVLQAAGFKSGLYTSPHLIYFNERFRVNNELITDEELTVLIDLIENISDKVAADMGQQPTFFECSTAIAFEYFKRQQVDVAIIETGMGGRLDATNVVDPLVSIITGISLEHTQYLGDTLAKVATEKAGIIKPGKPVVIGEMPDDALSVILHKADAYGSESVYSPDYTVVEQLSSNLRGQQMNIKTPDTEYTNITIPLSGRYQLKNLATVISALDIIRRTFDIPCYAIETGIRQVQWHGRFQIIKEHPPVILDGAHNPDAAKVLTETLRENAGGRKIAFVIGMCGDKDTQKFFDELAGISYTAWLVPLNNKRSIKVELLKHTAEKAGFHCVAEQSLVNAIAAAEEWAMANDGIVCITGSLYLAGDVLRFLHEN